MKRKIFMFFMATFAMQSFAQLTLEDCHQMAHDNYPAIRQYSLIEQSRDYTVSNAAKGFLPALKISASAYAFTDIMNLPAQMTTATGDMKNDLLNASVQVNQTIYDGGAISAKKRVAKAQADVDKGMLDVTMYDINNRIDQLFFGVLTIDEQIKQCLLLQDDLSLSRKTVDGMMKGGIANQSDVDAVEVEQIKARQNETSLRTNRHAYLTMLATFIGKQLNDNTVLQRPAQPEYLSTDQSRRPELDYYTAQSKLLDAQKSSLDAQLKPKVSAFALGMYHNTVSSLMHNSLFAAGVTLSWNIAPLYTRKNDLHTIDLQRQKIESNRATFLFNSSLQNQNTNGAIDNLKQQIAQDNQIISLRESIHSKSKKKVENGTETVNEMLRDVNAVSEARQQKALHEIQLLQQIYNLKNINNN
jgi:outer membrane protein TolC